MLPASITPETWAKITDWFGRAIELPPDRRAAFLQDICAQDPVAGRELASLVDEHERPDGFLPTLTVSAPLITDLSGTLVGPYRLVRLLGGGGMGAVYLAERSDGAFSKQVALKILSPAFFHAQARFQQEREFLARLDHPNVTRLLDGGSTANGLPYLVVEYVEGVPITRYCAERALPIDARLDLVVQLCAGIAHAHQHLIIHSDIKPDNVLVTADGHVKLLDFGIATLRDATRAATLNRPATPAYSSPEQLSGEPMTTAADVYSIGVVAYELLTGTLPYPLRTDHLGEILNAVLTADPVPASHAAGIPPADARRLRGDLDTILAKAIAKDPRRRYASAQQLADDIVRFRAGLPVLARPDSIGYRARKFVQRHRVATSLAVVTTVVLIAGITVSLWQARVARRRFDDLRQFAHAVVFDVSDSLVPIPGTTAARKLLVETALEYLDRLSRGGPSDPALREELAAAYVRVGRVQGGAFIASLGDSKGAVASFRKAIATARSASPTPGVQRVMVDAHINLAFLAADPSEAVPEFDAAIQTAERLLASAPNDVETLRLAADACAGRATADHVSDRVRDEVAISAREIEFRQRILALKPGDWLAEVALADAMAQHALAREQSADYAAAAAELGGAAAILDASLQRHSGNQAIARALADKHSRAGSVLVSMGDAGHATAELERARTLLEPLAAADPGNALYRGDLAYLWFRAAEAARARGDLAGALALHQQSLAARRERAAHDSTFTFVRWELSRSLNAVGDLLLLTAPRRVDEAAALFAEARTVAEETLRVAPSFNEVRKQIARADEGLGRAVLQRSAGGALEARALFERSLHEWEDILRAGPEDLRDTDRPVDIRRRLDALR